MPKVTNAHTKMVDIRVRLTNTIVIKILQIIVIKTIIIERRIGTGMVKEAGEKIDIMIKLALVGIDLDLWVMAIKNRTRNT